jgi:hypothetical protein
VYITEKGVSMLVYYERIGVPTKVLNQAVKRNKARFPSDFMFQIKTFEPIR